MTDWTANRWHSGVVSYQTGSANTTVATSDPELPRGIAILQRFAEFLAGEPSRERYAALRAWFDAFYWTELTDKDERSVDVASWAFHACCHADAPFKGKEPDEDIDIFADAIRDGVAAYKLTADWLSGNEGQG